MKKNIVLFIIIALSHAAYAVGPLSQPSSGHQSPSRRSGVRQQAMPYTTYATYQNTSGVAPNVMVNEGAGLLRVFADGGWFFRLSRDMKRIYPLSFENGQLSHSDGRKVPDEVKDEIIQYLKSVQSKGKVLDPKHQAFLVSQSVSEQKKKEDYPSLFAQNNDSEEDSSGQKQTPVSDSENKQTKVAAISIDYCQ